MADQHRPESPQSTVNDIMVSIHEPSDQKVKAEPSPHMEIREPQLPPDYVPLENRDPSKLSKFEKICLKLQPMMLYVVSMAQFLDIGTEN